MEANKLYSIGKISTMMGLSVQTLRFWEKIGLVIPSYINPDTGYRYYEYSQMHKIDRIKYLQSLGIKLQDIQRFYESENVDEIVANLMEQRERTLSELREVEGRLSDLEWYIDYFSFMKGKKHFKLPYLKMFPARHALVVPMGDGVPFSDTNDRFYTLRTTEPYKDLACRRQYISILDDKALLQGRNVTLLYGLYLKDGEALPEDKMVQALAPDPVPGRAAEDPQKDTAAPDPHILHLPAGEYICFLARIYREDLWDPSIFKDFLDPEKDYLVVADEYEDNLHRFDSCMYEVQILEKPSA